MAELASSGAGNRGSLTAPAAAAGAAAAADAPEPHDKITGGTRGIGAGIASCLARQGYNLVLGYNSDAAAAAEAAEQLTASHGVAVECVGGDTALPATWDAYHERLAGCFGGRLTAFVHNAGLIAGVTSQSEAAAAAGRGDDWESAYSYYHKVYCLAFKRGLSMALERCTGLRHVVAISAQGCNSTSGGPVVVYEAPGQAKAGLEFLVRLHAVRLAPQGINVNAIAPGFILTDAYKKLIPSEEAQQRMIAGTPAQRWGRPEEVGDLAAFLCSERAAFLTGASIPLDGGLHLARRG